LQLRTIHVNPEAQAAQNQAVDARKRLLLVNENVQKAIAKARRTRVRRPRQVLPMRSSRSPPRKMPLTMHRKGKFSAVTICDEPGLEADTKCIANLQKPL